MGTGQMIITFGAIMLMGVIVLNFNRLINDTDTNLDFNRFRLEAMSIMTSHVEQLSQYFYDEASTDTTSEKTLNDFTLPNNLGFEGNDSSLVDDIDDLNGTTAVDTGRSGAIYNVNYDLDYVTLSSDTFAASGTRQYHKRVNIAVSDAFNPPLIYEMVNGTRVRDTLKVSIVVSYWFYN
ncbi:hypothetical protein K8I28_04670 [bacterium]|nr:hypothetical protein [bacterium]